MIKGGGVVDPCDMNMLIAALANHFYTTLGKEDFTCLSVFFSELGKAMFTTELYRDLCDKKRRSCE